MPPVVVMGVQGSGKSTIGSSLAERLGITFIDGDSLHSDENVATMAAGLPLSDEQRMPWLSAVGAALVAGRDSGIVIACSALKRGYRDFLREYVPDLFVVFPHGSIELVAARISERQHEYMPPALLTSQYETLESLQENERGIAVDIALSPSNIVDAVVRTMTGSGARSARAH